MEPLPPIPFDKIDLIYEEAKKRHPAFAQMSLQDFSRYANQASQSDSFKAGDVGRFGATVKRASTGLDNLLKPVSDMAGSAGFELGSLISPRVGEASRSAFQGLPRTAAEMLAVLPAAAAVTAGAPLTIPLAIAGGAGLASTAARGYTETGSPLAGAIQAGTTALMPGAARVGTGIATKVMGPVGNVLEQTFGKTVARTGERVGEYVGANVGATVAGELGNQASSLAAGQGFQNPFTLENVVGNTIGQLPFAAFDIPQLARGYKPTMVGDNQVGVAPVGMRDLGQAAPIPSLTEWQRMQQAAEFASRAEQIARQASQSAAAAQTLKPANPGPPPSPANMVIAPAAQPVVPAAVEKPATPAVDTSLGLSPLQEEELTKKAKSTMTGQGLFVVLNPSTQTMLPGRTREERSAFLDKWLKNKFPLGAVEPTVVKGSEAQGEGRVPSAPIVKLELNATQKKILATAYDNEHGKGWLKLPDGRETTKAAMAELREAGLVEYVNTGKWAGNQLKVTEAPASKDSTLLDPINPSPAQGPNPQQKVALFRALQKTKKRTSKEEAQFVQLEQEFGQLPLPIREPALKNLLTGEVYKGGAMHALVPIPGKVDPNHLERGWVDGTGSYFPADPETSKKVSELISEMENEGVPSDRLVNAAAAMSDAVLRPGEDAWSWIARRAGLDPRINEQGSPEALLATTSKYFGDYYRVRGFAPETAQFMTELSTRVAGRFGALLPRVRVGASTSESNFYASARAGRWNDVIALAGKNFINRSQAIESMGQMMALGHEAYHALESRLAQGTLPTELQPMMVRALDTAKTMTVEDRREVIDWFTEKLVGKEGRGVYDYRKSAYEDPNTGATEFVADLTGLLALASTTKDGVITVKDWAKFGNATTTGYIQGVVQFLNETLQAILRYFKTAMGMGKLDPKIMAQYEEIASNLKGLMLDSQRADKAALAFNSVIDRTMSDILDYQPTLSRQQAAKLLNDSEAFEAGELKPVPQQEVEEALQAIEQVTAKKDAFGKRASWYHWGYPMSQLSARFPELRDAVDLGFKHREVAARYLQEAWGMHFTDERGKFDQARLKRIGKEGSKTNDGYNAAALLMNAEERLILGRELETFLKDTVPGISSKEIADIEKSFQQFGQMNVGLARLRVQSHTEDVIGGVAGLIMSHDRTIKGKVAWDLANTLISNAFNEQGGLVGMRDMVAKAMLQKGYDADLSATVGQAVEEKWKPHLALAQKLLGKDLQGKPWWSTEVRMGNWTVAYQTLDGKRHLEAFREQGPATKRVQALQEKLAKGELKYVKAFNKADRMENFKNLQSEMIDAYKDADSIFYKSMIERIRQKAPEIASEMEELFQPGQGATRMTTSPYLLKRELVGGRETLNMVAGQAHYVDSTAYGLAKRYVKTRQRVILHDPELMKNEQLRAMAKSYLSAVTDPEGKEFTGLKNMVFFHFMGFNPSHLVIEPMQLLSSHVPLLVRNGDGIGAAYARLSRAGTAVGAASVKRLLSRDGEVMPSAKGLKGGITDGNLDDLLKEGKLARVVETGFVSDMFSLEDTEFATSRSLLTGSGKLGGAKDVVKNAAYWMTQVARKFYGIAPRFNSRVALISAYEQGRMAKMGHDAAVAYAITSARESMFGGGTVNRPMALHVLGKAQGVGGLAYSLQSYTANMYAFMGRLVHDSLAKSGLNAGEMRSARKALWTMGTTQLLFGGIVGFPMVGTAIAIWDQLFRDSDVKRDLRQVFFDLAGDDEDFGNLLAEGAMGGALNAVLPVADVGSRFQLGTFFGVSPYDGFTWKNLFGPSASLAESYAKGARGLIEGDAQAAAGMIPAGPRGAIKLMMNDGALRDSKGRMLIDPTDAEKALTVMGFKPRRLSQAYEQNAMEQRAQETVDRDRDRFLSRMADLVQEGRPNDVTTALYERQRQLPGQFDAKAAVRRIAQIVQERRTPRAGVVSGSMEAAASMQRIQALYPSLSTPGRSAVNTYMESRALERTLGVPGTGRPDPSALRRAALVDKLMTDNPSISQQMAEMLAERLMHPRATQQRFGPGGVSP